MMRNKLLIGTNLKMYKGVSDTCQYLESLKALTADIVDQVSIFVIPSYVALDQASKLLQSQAIMLGAQNMHHEQAGQYTGEISPVMLKELGIKVVEIGHSERRQIFNETDEEENAKILSALSHGLTPLLCVGETTQQKSFGIVDEVLSTQLKIGLHGVSELSSNQLWVAYEPVWAIGVNGTPAEPNYVKERHAFIRSILNRFFPNIDIPILYGGSVNQENAIDFITLPNVDGLFIGRSAWEAEKFDQLIRKTLPIWQEKEKNDAEVR